MSRIADEHLKALAGAQQPINAPWAAGTQTQRAHEFDQSMALEREKFDFSKEQAAAAQLAEATGAQSNIPFGAEVPYHGQFLQNQDPYVATLPQERVPLYLFVAEAVKGGDTWSEVLDTLEEVGDIEGWNDAARKDIIRFAERAYGREIGKVYQPSASGNVMKGLADVAQRHAPAGLTSPGTGAGASPRDQHMDLRDYQEWNQQQLLDQGKAGWDSEIHSDKVTFPGGSAIGTTGVNPLDALRGLMGKPRR